MSTERAIVIAKMREAFREGKSASRFILEMRELGLSYRRTTMLTDWANVNQLEQKEGRLRFIRKGYAPAAATIELKEWAMSREYMYKIKVESRLRPDEPLISRFVNIMSDTPLTVEQITQITIEKWAMWEKYQPEILENIVPWAAIHRTI